MGIILYCLSEHSTLSIADEQDLPCAIRTRITVNLEHGLVTLPICKSYPVGHKLGSLMKLRSLFHVLALFYFSLVWLFLPQTSVASEQTFATAVQLAQTGKHNEAIELFYELHQKHPQNLEIVYNLGLAYFKSNQLGPALALFYSLKRTDPQNSLYATALREVQKKLPADRRVIAPDFFSFSEDLLRNFVRWDQLVVVMLLSLFIFGRQVVKFIGRTKMAQQTEGPRPQFGLLFYLNSLLLFLLVISSSYKGILDHKEQVVVTTSGSLLAGPSLTTAPLVSLNPGDILTLVAQEPDWLLARSSDRFLGWIPKKDIYPIRPLF